uniref:Putative DNA binding, helix-turn-helix domain containing protein n=1 Tax=viral metagenome TaxID=1070528 RepID=A0A6M3L9E4_9ZZZZ
MTTNKLMTTKELAEYLNLHVATIRKYAELKIIPGIQIGKSWRFQKDVIDKWFKDGGFNARSND